MDLAIGRVGKTYVLPKSVKPTKEQMKEVAKVKKELKQKADAQKKIDNKAASQWVDKQKRKGKLSGAAWSDYKMKFAS